MNKWICENCGGLTPPTEVSCPYCGSKVTVSKTISPDDKKRMTSIAKIITSSLDRNAFSREYGVNRSFVYINMLLTILITWLLFITSSSLVVTGIIPVLLAALIFAAYDEEYWHILRKATEQEIYDTSIKPAITHFLESFNYYGCDWEKTVTELYEDNVLFDSRDFFTRLYSYKQEKSGKDAVLFHASEELTENAYMTMSKRKVYYYLAAGYLISLSALLYFLIFETFWIPLVWTVPILVLSILLVADKIYIYALDFDYKYDPQLLKEKIIPLLKQYCRDTGEDYSVLIDHAKEIDLYTLWDWLKRLEGGET